jgi:NADH-ubiquinone oxidoreductase chain 4
MFYIFFESILPLLFLLIGLYGASQKFRAGYYIFLYTLLGSLFMLLSFVKGGSDTGTPYFEENSNNKPHLSLQKYICFILFGSFSVKTPLIPVHI